MTKIKKHKKAESKSKKPYQKKRADQYVFDAEEHSEADENPAIRSGTEDDNSEGEDLTLHSGRRDRDPQGVFNFDSASESDDEKMLEERLRQFERVHFNETVASDLEDEDDNDADENDMEISERPIRNKYGGGVNEQFLEIVDDEGGDEPSAAVLEEQEAKLIQQRLASMVSENDVNLEFLGIPIESEAVEDLADKSEPQMAVGDGASSRELQSIVNKRCPELEPLIDRLKYEMKNLSSKWIPLLRLIEGQNSSELQEKLGRSAVSFIRAKHLIGFTYCVNVLFYLRLRAHHDPVDGHPVTARVVSYHKLLEQLQDAETFYMKPGKRLDALLEAQKSGKSVDKLLKDIEKAAFGVDKRPLIPSRRPIPASDGSEAAVEAENDDEAVSLEKRKLTDNMEKNTIGGKHPRNKGKRNPRVANRNRFTKALKRRKASGVREWQAPINVYGGEMTGIRAGVRRSVKLKA